MSSEKNLSVAKPGLLAVFVLSEIFQAGFFFERLWYPLKKDRVSEINTRSVVRGRLSQAFGEILGTRDHEGAVENKKVLLGNRALGASCAGGAGCWEVKDSKKLL